MILIQRHIDQNGKKVSGMGTGEGDPPTPAAGVSPKWVIEKPHTAVILGSSGSPQPARQGGGGWTNSV